MSTQKAPDYKKSYPWAINQIKLDEAIRDLENAHADDKTVIIDEASIKYRYILRKGAIKKSEADLEEEAKAARAKKIADARALIAEEEANEVKDEELKAGRKPSKKAKDEEKEPAKEE
jgi:hypothetical protein